jgi:hypothetical protein
VHPIYLDLLKPFFSHQIDRWIVGQFSFSKLVHLSYYREVASGRILDPGWIEDSGEITKLEVPAKVPYNVLITLMKDLGRDWDIDYELDRGQAHHRSPHHRQPHHPALHRRRVQAPHHRRLLRRIQGSRYRRRRVGMATAALLDLPSFAMPM